MKKLTAFILCHIFLLSFAFISSAEQAKETVYATESVNIRTEPNTDCDIVSVLQKGNCIIRIGDTDGWSKVIYEGEERYITSEYLSLSPPAEKTEDEKTEEPQTEDNSTPRLMVISYEISEKSLSPENSAVLKVSFRNYSSSKAIYNIKLSLDDPSGDILTVGMPTAFVSCINAGSCYIWEIELRAVNTASIGQHDLHIRTEYEDKNFCSYSSDDTVRIDVRQSVKLSYSGAILPKKVIQGDTQTVTVDLMNTGKSTIYNCTLSFDIEGMQSGGSVFVGNIAPAMNAQGSANLRVDSDILGKVTGNITIAYEDDYGIGYKEIIEVSTVIEEKLLQFVNEAEDEKESGNPLWWLFIIVGAAVGAGTALLIPHLIKDRKQRKEDDLRL